MVIKQNMVTCLLCLLSENSLNMSVMFFVAEIKLLEFKPSIIAASALLMASHELFPLQFPSFETSILCCRHVNKVRNWNYEALLKFIFFSITSGK